MIHEAQNEEVNDKESIHMIRMWRSRSVAPKDTPKISDRQILIRLGPHYYCERIFSFDGDQIRIAQETTHQIRHHSQGLKMKL